MQRNDIKIRSSESPEFDCYVVTPETAQKVPAVVLASAIHGVDKDLRAIADEFAARGFIAAAPDLFSRSVPGPLGRGDDRTKGRGQPRAEKIKAGEADLVDTLTMLRKSETQYNGKAAVMGFCYGGPYAIIGPKRLGFAAGVSCHGTNMLDYVKEIEGTTQPICIIWGEKDHAAPPPTFETYRAVPARNKNVEVHIFPGVLHGYMMPDAKEAYSEETRKFSMDRTLAILARLRDK